MGEGRKRRSLGCPGDGRGPNVGVVHIERREGEKGLEIKLQVLVVF